MVAADLIRLLELTMIGHDDEVGPAVLYRGRFMSIALRTEGVAAKGSRLKIHLPASQVAGTTHWIINGFPATILIWSADEWARLIDRPEHAQQFPNGIWCLLRID